MHEKTLIAWLSLILNPLLLCKIIDMEKPLWFLLYNLWVCIDSQKKWTMNQHTRVLGKCLPLHTCSLALSIEAFVQAKIASALATFFGKGNLLALGSFQS
jgi:hypothetical protein